MELKLKDGYEELTIFIPQENTNMVGKFIDSRLYPHLYNLYPDLFDVIETKKTKKVDDLYIDNTIEPSGSNIG